MTEQDQITFTHYFNRWFCGNVDAARLAALLTEAAHVIDDLYDRDVVVSQATTARVFRVLLIDVPGNPFYRNNFSFLQPLLTSTWMQWQAANVMEEQKTPGDREKSYMLRAGLYGLFHGIAVLTGGLDWAEKIGPEIYRAYGETLESFDA